MVAGLFNTLHVQLTHPSSFQLKKVLSRSFWCLDFDKCIANVSKMCHQCLAIDHMPVFKENSTSEAVKAVGCNFAADVMIRDKKHILVLRESVTSYTWARIIPNETTATLKLYLLILVSEACTPGGTLPIIRVDPAPCFRSMLLQAGDLPFVLVLGREKNVNKNPIAEKAVQELSVEMLKINAEGQVSESILARSVSVLNARVRFARLSARELWTQRDQFTKRPIIVDDDELIRVQLENRVKSHPPPPTYVPVVKKGDIVFLCSERNKSHARSKYIVLNAVGSKASVRKFTGNQLRTRVYEVPLSDLYVVPVVAETSNSESDSDNDDGCSIPAEIVDVDNTEKVDSPTIRRYPLRERRRPQYLADYDLSQ